MNGKSSTLLIIVFAALALFCFAVKSFYDYQVTKLKLEHGIEISEASDPQGASGSLPAPPPVASALPAFQSQAAAPTLFPAASPETVPAPASDPDLEKMKLEMDALRAENSLYAEKIDEIRSTGGSATGGAPAAAAPIVPKVSPEEQAQLDALRAQVTKAPAIGQVKQCNWDFDLVWIDGGSDRNLKTGDTFAVRRGYEIMGFLTVEEVEENFSVSKLTSSNRGSQTARRPEVGDDVIKWPLF
jgi:hypothetical protein